MRLARGSFALVTLLACTEAEPKTATGPTTTVEAPPPPAVTTVAPAPQASSAPPGAPRPSRVTTIGDQTCKADADCAITNHSDCCRCCPEQPLATSRKWLAWRDGQCKTTRCEPCANAPCEEVESPSAYVSLCRQGRCELVHKAEYYPM